MEAVERFRALLAGDWRLDEGALAIAAGADPDLRPEPWLAELDRLADGIRDFAGLRRRLFVEEGFAGDGEHYHDPRNSLLHHVLTRRLGLPITLSVVAIEVGRRAGVVLEGVAMPGHFLLRHAGTSVYVDAFSGGELLDLAGCAERFRRTTGARIPFGDYLLPVATEPAILARVLENLRAVYRAAGRPADLEWVLQMRRCLPGAGVDEVLELGTALGAQGRWHEAAAHLEAAAAEHPDDADRLRTAARGQRAHLN